MRIQKIIIIIGLITILLSCESRFISIEEICKKYDTKIPEVSAFPNTSAVIILDKTEWEMEVTENFELKTSKTIHVVKKIFKNLNDHSIIKIPVFQGDKIIEISARTIKPDGTTIPVKKEDIYEIEGIDGESEFYSDTKYTKFTFPGLEEGCIIEYYYKKYVKNPFFRDIWLLQNEIPILYSEYSLTVPELLMTRGKWTWSYKVYNDKELGDVERSNVIQNIDTDLDKQLNFKWIKRNIEPFNSEPLMPSGLTEIPHVRFRPGFWNNWDDISSWYYSELFSEKLILSEKIKSKANSLTKHIEDRTEKIKACYDFVKDIRYISINLNNEGITPNEPEVVLEHNFGDCKDKSILLIGLLKALDIKAEPVLLLTNTQGSFDKNFPSWNFNHMIVTAKDDSDQNIWMDCTAKYTDFGELPAMDQDIDVLVLHDNGSSSILRTKTTDPDYNKKIIDVKIEISENLESNIELNIKYFGEDRSKIKYFLEHSSEDEINKFCKSMINDAFLNSSIDSVVYSDSLLQRFFNLNFLVKSADVVQKQGKLFFVSYDFLPIVSDMDWLLLDQRKYPLVFSYPCKISKNLSITFPENKFALNTIPGNLKIDEKEVVSYSRIIDTRSNVINMSADLIIKNKIIPVKDYNKLRESFEYIQKKNKEQLILNKI